MKCFAMTAVAASAMFAALSMPAFAQTAMTKCEPGEGQILEYDFGRNFEGQLSLETLSSLRLASSNCAPGQPGKTTFRGVNAEFENMTQTQKAIGATQVFISLGITDPAVIEQLIARVKTGIQQVEEQRQVKYKMSVYVLEIAADS